MQLQPSMKPFAGWRADGLPKSGSRLASRTASAPVCVAVAFLLSWLCPYHTYPYWSFYHDYISLLGIVLATLILFSDDQRPAAVVPRTVFLPLGLATVILADALTGHMPTRPDAILPIGYLVAAAVAMVLGTNIARDGRDAAPSRAFRLVAIVLVVAGVVSTAIAFTQYLGVDDRLRDLIVGINNDGAEAVRPYANLGQPNQLALVLCWSLAGLWYLHQSRRLAGWAATFLAVDLLAGLVLTQSKIVWLIVPVFLAATWWLSRRAGLRPVARGVLVALAVWFVASILLLPSLSASLGFVTESVNQRLETNGVRLVMILQGFYISLHHPLIGVGWNGFGAHQIDVAPLFADTQYAMHAHDFVANLAAETGWPVTLAVLGSIGYWLHSRFVGKPVTPDTILVLLVLAAVAIHSMVEFPLWYAYVLMPVAYLVGLVEGRHENRSALTASRTLVVAVALLLAAAMVVVASDYRRLVQGFRALGYEKIGWTYDEGSIAQPEWTIFAPFYRYMAFSNVRPTIAMTPEEIVGYEQVARRFGYAPVLYRLATIYALNGREDDAVRMIDALRHLYPPRYPETYAAWKVLAAEYPEVLGKVYQRLPVPAPR